MAPGNSGLFLWMFLCKNECKKEQDQSCLCKYLKPDQEFICLIYVSCSRAEDRFSEQQADECYCYGESVCVCVHEGMTHRALTV